MKSPTTVERLIELNAWLDSGFHVELRKRADIPQGAIANDVGVTQGCVSKWEAGTKRPTGPRAVAYHRTLRKILDAKERA